MNIVLSKIQFLSIVMILSFGAYSQEETNYIGQDILGADDLIDHIDKNEIEIVSASRTMKKLGDLPVTTYVITREEILMNGYTSLVDVLKPLPGFKVSQPGSGELGQMFLMRGLNGNSYTKVLINNIPITPSVLTGLPIEEQLPIRQAERIEVIYGPASAVYGADATAGVINIITKEADQGIFAHADIMLGGNEYSYVSFTAGGKIGRNDKILKYSFYGSKSEFKEMNIFNDMNVYKPLKYQDLINFRAFEELVEKPSDLTEEILAQIGITFEDIIPENYDGNINEPEIKDISSKSHIVGKELKYKGLRLTYENMYSQTHSSIGWASYLYKYNNPQNFTGGTTNRTAINYNKSWGRISLTSNLSYLTYNLDENSNFGVTFINNTDKVYYYTSSDDILAEQLFTYSGKNFEIVSGISYQYSGNMPTTNYMNKPFDTDRYESFSKSIDDDEIFGNFGLNPYVFSNFSSFIQGYSVFSNFILMGGVRFDYNSEYSYSFNPRAAVLWKINDKTSLRASLGKAFKAP
ncbi:MAG: TonB-dependent receptor [bacterium]|nr:TonB-dependent receptor [bacterium]